MPKLKLKKSLKRSEIYRITIFMVMVLIIISIAYVGYLKSNNTISSDISVSDLFKKFFSFNSNNEVKLKTIVFKNKDLKSLDVGENYLYKVTKENIEIYDKSGSNVNSFDINMNNPVVKANGEYAVVVNLEGSEIIYLKNAKIVNDIKTKKNIVNFSLNEKGYVLYLDEAKEYRTATNLLDPNGTEIFDKGKGEQFIIDAKISPKSDFVIMSVIDTSGVYANTNIEYIDSTVNFGKVISSTSKDDSIYSTIIPFEEGSAVIGSSELAYYNKESTLKWEKTLNGRIQSVTPVNDSEFAISTNNSSNNMMDTNESEIKMFNIKGKIVSNYKVLGSVKNIRSYKNKLLTYTSRDIYVNDDDGDNLWKKSLKEDIIDVYFLYEDRIAVVDREKIEIYKISL
ncbi:MAG: DUF5711 family protein [Clostridiales bacterium]